MSIPSDMIILAAVITVAAALPTAHVSSPGASQQQQASTFSASPQQLASSPGASPQPQASTFSASPLQLASSPGASLQLASSPGASLQLASSRYAWPQQPTSHVMGRSGGAADADTIRSSVRGGDVLIIDLPEEFEGETIGSYSLLQAPALSWLVDYSFMWRTLPEDAGTHNVLIHANGLADTLVMAIVVE